MDSSKFLQLPPKGKDAPTAPWLWGFGALLHVSLTAEMAYVDKYGQLEEGL